ncbi:hypothetical protein [Paenibacillus sp. SYP-B4298]|uniref:hypothetical protein n=1 Tax=Paenibacillus sp. SYP-B4298 TaxID=2996034 RepID=UPI0022DE5D44|nr:hypothetical protein [Paenibacillus sp. SYP-B4298]
MERVYPLNEETLAPLRGRVVCAITQEGHHYIGVLHSCSGGRLVLNGPEDETPGDGEPHPTSGARLRSRRRRPGRKTPQKSSKASTMALGGYPGYNYPPYGYPGRYGPPIGLDLALLAFLFLLV